MRDKVQWTRYEVLLPQPSYSKIGHTIDQMTSSRPMIRSILRSQSYARTVSVEQQDRKWTEMARAKYVKEKDPSVASFEAGLAKPRAVPLGAEPAQRREQPHALGEALLAARRPHELRARAHAAIRAQAPRTTRADGAEARADAASEEHAAGP